MSAPSSVTTEHVRRRVRLARLLTAAAVVRGAGASRWGWIRLVVVPVVLLLLVWRLGTGPFVDGLRAVDATALLVATLVGLVTTVCCAWRWRLVARGLDVDLPVVSGIASYYRSQFLNTMLPGGVLGDVHRAVRHGRDVGSRSTGARTVAWERSAGQAVQAVLTVVALAVLPSPVGPLMPMVLVVSGSLLLMAFLAYRLVPVDGSSGLARAGSALRTDLRDGLLPARTWPGVVLASAVVVAGHVFCFLVAARTAGATASLARLVPLALVVLLAMAVPLNLGGWGPREGVAAWVFAAAGLGAGLGVSTAVVYGVMGIVACLPGLVVLAAQELRVAAPKAPAPEMAAAALAPTGTGASCRA